MQSASTRRSKLGRLGKWLMLENMPKFDDDDDVTAGKLRLSILGVVVNDAPSNMNMPPVKEVNVP